MEWDQLHGCGFQYGPPWALAPSLSTPPHPHQRPMHRLPPKQTAAEVLLLGSCPPSTPTIDAELRLLAPGLPQPVLVGNHVRPPPRGRTRACRGAAAAAPARAPAPRPAPTPSRRLPLLLLLPIPRVRDLLVLLRVPGALPRGVDGRAAGLQVRCVSRLVRLGCRSRRPPRLALP